MMKPIRYDKPDSSATSPLMAAEPLAMYLSSANVSSFPVSKFVALNKKLPFTQQEWADMLHISDRTLQRYLKDRKPFEGLHAEHLHQLNALVDIGLVVFGGATGFEAWLRSPKYILGNEVGLEALRSFGGAQLVLDELGRMAYGVYS
ncbi:antitoxin Xre/MbcA/ParS toxin-binding domain-containing protein [Parapedobacter sp. 2B3]|uniref:type II RES/Xre toxin-antitoxin system antitoxin n=1 Tax=Parapedobacter sp. 2B3 TaxID=3342381 RepID=UPI0035B62E40